jgi:hypothetical protein
MLMQENRVKLPKSFVAINLSERHAQEQGEEETKKKKKMEGGLGEQKVEEVTAVFADKQENRAEQEVKKDAVEEATDDL